ncbi:MAG TPA: FMN-binding protein [Gemmatimonadaceae bacterium]|nr:FMN-binding protein [Gemmatimonadaceae bacterium]
MGKGRTAAPRAGRTLTLAAVVAVAGALVASPCAAGAQEVLATPEQALHEIFPEGAHTSREVRALAPAVKQRLETTLGRRILEDSVEVTLVHDAADRPVGYAVVTEEIGKYRPITFMVGVTPQLAVRDVMVLVYRESRGGDVKRERFLSQYRGKRATDPIDINRDIINISGATISVRSLNAGVRRVLAELTALYGPSGTGPTGGP